MTREADTADELPAVAPSTLGTDTDLTAWLTDTRAALTAPPTPGPVSDFTESYLAHRSAEQERGPDAETTSGPQSEWGASTDSAPDPW